jgi:hypothetical protein
VPNESPDNFFRFFYGSAIKRALFSGFTQRKGVTGMIIGYFTERPYRWLPEDEVLRNEGFFAVSNKYFDREKAADDYNYWIDEYCEAEELGFDALMLNEHHGNPFCMGSVMNVEAAILARVTKNGVILQRKSE